MKIKKYRKVSKKPRRKSLNKSRKKKRVKKGGSIKIIPKNYINPSLEYEKLKLQYNFKCI